MDDLRTSHPHRKGSLPTHHRCSAWAAQRWDGREGTEVAVPDSRTVPYSSSTVRGAEIRPGPLPRVCVGSGRTMNVARRTPWAPAARPRAQHWHRR